MPSSWMLPPDRGDGVCRAMSMSGDVSIGVDIGGTFTDVVVRRPGAPTRIMKIPSTRKDPSIAVLEAVKRMETESGLPPQQVARFVHGTTIATNAVLERKGACIGLITTQGFRDVLEIGRQMRHQMYDLALDPETPTFLAPGRLRREIRERISATGEVLEALDEAAVTAIADELVSAGAQAIAVVFLFSFLNNSHERRAREIIAARHPHVFVSLSSEVDPAFREYERTVVTAFDAYVKPVVDRYLANLDAGLLAAAVPAPLQIMQSRGGICSSATARLRSVRLFLSGCRRDRGEDGGRGRRLARPDNRRYRWHVVRYRADRRWRAGVALGGPHRWLSGAREHARRQLDRGRRRFDCVARRHSGPAGWAAVGRLRTRARLLRPRRKRADLDRCLRRPRLSGSRTLCRRPPQALARAQPKSNRARDCAPLEFHGRAGRPRHPPHRQCAGGGRHPPGIDPAGPRSA